MNKTFFSKALNVGCIITGGMVLLGSIPLLITSHVKHKKEHPELKGTNQETRDDLIVAGTTASMTVISTKIICDAILSLKKK